MTSADIATIVRDEMKSAFEAIACATESVKAARSLANMSPRRQKEQKGPDILALDLDVPIGAEGRPLKCKMSIKQKEVACIMGPSGVGKSTLLKIVNDMFRPQARRASLKLCDVDSQEMNSQQWRRDVLYVHQSAGALPDTPRDLIRAIERLEVRRGLPELDPTPFLKQWDLPEDSLERDWNKLSGGERQRTMIAIALAAGPKVLLLDEPTSALDDATKEKVEENIRELQCAVLFVTHDKVQAERIATSVWRMIEVDLDAYQSGVVGHSAMSPRSPEW
jgi:ABC-type phosphate transport system ATPase subunit